MLTYIGCTYGVLYTSLSNAGFICALPVVVTPLLEWLFLRKRPDRRLAVALVLCTVGMGLHDPQWGARRRWEISSACYAP